MRDSLNNQSDRMTKKLIQKLLSFFSDIDNRVCIILFASLLIILGLRFIENRFGSLIIPMLYVIFLFSYTHHLAKRDNDIESQ